MSALVLYTAPGCHLCKDAMETLRELQSELGFELEEVDITGEESLHRAYFERIPVLCADDGEELCEYFVDETVVRERLESRR